MDIATIILFAGVLIFAAHFFSWLFSFTKVPDVLLLIAIGLVLGPLLGVLTPEFFGQAGGLFGTIVLAVILFEGGIDLRLDVIRQAWKSSLALTLANLIFVFLVVSIPLWYFTDLGAILSLTVAAIVSGTASIVIIPLIERLNVTPQSKAITLLEAAFTDVSSIVLTIALLKAYEIGEITVSDAFFDIVLSFVVAAVIGVAGGIIWSLLLNKVRNIQNSIFTTPAYVFILFGLVELLGFSGPIAVLAFGITMGNIVFFKLYLERKHLLLHTLLHPMALSTTERTFFSEVVFLLETFFFVYVGMSITFASTTVLLWALALTGLMFLVRIPAVRFATPKTVPAKDASYMSVMVPIGLAAAVLASLPLQRGIPQGQFIQDVVFAMILFSIMGTSLGIFLTSNTGVGQLYAFFMGKRDVVSVPGQNEVTEAQ